MDNLTILAVSNEHILCTFDITVPIDHTPYEITDVSRAMLRGITIKHGDFVFDIQEHHSGNSTDGYLNLGTRGQDRMLQTLSCDGPRWKLISSMLPVCRGAWMDLARVDSATVRNASTTENTLTLHCVDLFYTDHTKPSGVGEPVFK